eukprot:6640531-Prymnesium_polylepis.4
MYSVAFVRQAAERARDPRTLSPREPAAADRLLHRRRGALPCLPVDGWSVRKESNSAVGGIARTPPDTASL